MMNRYETLVLAVPEITQDEIKSVETELDRIIRANKGSLISFERWGKYRLAYPVKKNEYGVYCLVRFEMPAGTSLLKDIDALFVVKLNDIVMRNMITVLDPNQSLAYQRPKSLEDSPSREVGGFLKDDRSDRLMADSNGFSKHDMHDLDEGPGDKDSEDLD
jgi:small subunit ribosomal protein S6